MSAKLDAPFIRVGDIVTPTAEHYWSPREDPAIGIVCKIEKGVRWSYKVKWLQMDGLYSWSANLLKVIGHCELPAPDSPSDTIGNK